MRTKNWCWCRATGSWKATANGWREVCRAGVFFPEKEGPDIAMPLCKSRVQRWEHHWKPRVLYVSTHQSGSSKEERESLVRAFFFSKGKTIISARGNREWIIKRIVSFLSFPVTLLIVVVFAFFSVVLDSRGTVLTQIIKNAFFCFSSSAVCFALYCS